MQNKKLVSETEKYTAHKNGTNHEGLVVALKHSIFANLGNFESIDFVIKQIERIICQKQTLIKKTFRFRGFTKNLNGTVSPYCILTHNLLNFVMAEITIHLKRISKLKNSPNQEIAIKEHKSLLNANLNLFLSLYYNTFKFTNEQKKQLMTYIKINADLLLNTKQPEGFLKLLELVEQVSNAKFLDGSYSSIDTASIEIKNNLVLN